MTQLSSVTHKYSQHNTMHLWLRLYIRHNATYAYFWFQYLQAYKAAFAFKQIWKFKFTFDKCIF